MPDLRKHVQIWCLILSLVVMSSACEQPGKDSAASLHHTPTTASTLDQQTCPAQGLARAANMPSRPAGGHPNLIYRSWHPGPAYPGGSDPVPLISIAGGDLLRYDSVTAASTLILQESQIASVNVSPDGQWLLLVSSVQRSPVQNRERIQLIRIDGQHLQTLYCAPEDAYIGMVLFSPDQHALVFTQARPPGETRLPRENGNTYLLDVATGKLRLVLSSDRPGYPSISKANQCCGGILEPMKWATNNSVYFSTDSGDELMNGIVSLSYGFDLYLLHDSRKDASQQQSNLQLIAPATSENQCGDFDITPDNRQLACIVDSASRSDTLKMASPAGSMFHIMYHDTIGILRARVISNTTLLFIQTYIAPGEMGPDGEEALWKINTDGSQPVKLMTSPGPAGYWFDFADDRQSWSTLSRDGSLYVVTASALQSLLIGSLNGGPTKTIPLPKGTSTITPVGWTQF